MPGPAIVAAPGRGRLLGVDVLRGVGALSVVALHANILPVGQLMDGPGLWQRVAHLALYWSDAGVDLLFVVSGMQITGPWVRALLDGRELPALGSYTRRRLCRILPAFWLTLFVLEASRPGRPFPTLREPVSALLQQMFLLVPPTPSQDFGLFVAWSLQVEVVLYLATPLVAHRIARRWPDPLLRQRALLRTATVVVAIGLVTAVLAGVGPWGHAWQRPLRFSVPAGIALIVPGVLLALVNTPTFAASHPVAASRWRRLTRDTPTLLLAGTCLITLSLAMEATGDVLGFTLARFPRVIVAAMVLQRAAAFSPGRRRVPVRRTLAALGTISYGVYLWHCVWLSLLVDHGITDGLGAWWSNAAMLLGISVGCSLVTWYALERPLQRWSHRPRVSAPAVRTRSLASR